MLKEKYNASRIFLTKWHLMHHECLGRKSKNALECCPLRCRLRLAFVIFSAKINNSASWIVTRIIKIKLNNNMCIKNIIHTTMLSQKIIGKWINLRINRCLIINITRISIMFTNWVRWYHRIKRLLLLKTVSITQGITLLHKSLIKICHFFVICYCNNFTTSRNYISRFISLFIFVFYDDFY